MTDSAVPEPTKSAGVRAAVPLAIPVFAFGISFGTLAEAAGLSPLLTIGMSATTFAGSAQFAAVSILSAGGSVAAALIAGILLNARYLPIGISLAPAISGPVWRRFLEAQLAVDESWAVAHVGQGRYNRSLFIGAGLTLYLSWLLGTAIGLAAGGLLGDPGRLGLDAAFPALFLVLLAPRLNEGAERWAAFAGAVVALSLVPLAPAGVPILAAVLPPLVIARLTWQAP
jgi:4-azaleucine resistance transporter AzlC